MKCTPHECSPHAPREDCRHAERDDYTFLWKTAMPIRFRCAYCNQLMGIARRKAGSVVNCPTCHGQVMVPMPAPEPAVPPPDPPTAKTPEKNPFEQQDFDPSVFASRQLQTRVPDKSPPPPSHTL